MKIKFKNTMIRLGLLVLIITAFVGEIKCTVKAVKCNWEPIGKAEVLYTASAFTGLGCVVGYLDIKDK